MRNPDKFRGCLIGGAVGDALGWPIEFLDEDEIFGKYGPQGISDYVLRNGVAEITDDTQMTLFTAAGLLSAAARSVRHGSAPDYASAINEAYLNWLQTQELIADPRKKVLRRSWLVDIDDLYVCRAPGNACLAALGKGGGGSVENPINSSKGCGGVMRVAPVGLFFNDKGMQAEEICRIGAAAAALTHGHMLGWLPAAMFSQMIHEICQNDLSVPDAARAAISTAESMWKECRDLYYCTDLVDKALYFASLDRDDLSDIHALGEGWVGEEALAIAVYCAAKYEDDFDKAIRTAVNHEGDSDSVGAVAGNLLGARLGLAGIPGKYLDNLELKQVILEMADDLWTGYPENDPDLLSRWDSRYPD